MAMSLPTCVLSAQVSGLYKASVTVDSQNTAQRNDALAQALEQVLIKVSGDEAALESSGAKSLLSAPEKYVVAFSYSENPAHRKALDVLEAAEQKTELDPDTPPGVESAADNQAKSSLSEAPADGALLSADLPPRFVLDVSFAQSSVEQALTSYGVPIWGRTRPSMLVWLVDEHQGERRLLGASEQAFVEELKLEADRRALPVFFPVVDLADLSSVDLNALWGLFPDAVSKAAKRYQPDLNVLVRMNTGLPSTDVQKSYSADWVFQLKEREYTGIASGSSVQALWQGLLAQVSAVLAARYAVQQNSDAQSGWLTIEVDQIKGFEDYAALQSYLQGLPSVGRIELQWVKGARLSYRLKLKGQREQFYEYIELGGRLKWMASSAPVPPQPALALERSQPEAALIPVPDVSATEHFLWTGHASSRAN